MSQDTLRTLGCEAKAQSWEWIGLDPANVEPQAGSLSDMQQPQQSRPLSSSNDILASTAQAASVEWPAVRTRRRKPDKRRTRNSAPQDDQDHLFSRLAQAVLFLTMAMLQISV